MLNTSVSSILISGRGSVFSMTTLAERIAEAIKHSGKRPSQIARECRVTPAAVSLWLDGSTQNLRMEYLFALEDATGYSARWIGIGQGPKIRNGDPRKDALNTLWDHTDERGRANIFRVAEAESHYGPDASWPSNGTRSAQ